MDMKESAKNPYSYNFICLLDLKGRILQLQSRRSYGVWICRCATSGFCGRPVKIITVAYVLPLDYEAKFLYSNEVSCYQT
ncbi:hypothetical protein C5167_025203 [Papaver somniferum]|uniref:Uncharacterized protein n=1 Tax=Papaver somniferum TaxID=3469 RepID=A0A4Y7JTT7_PAPSO|nr:hypothetical protein C5167_025203 [Papaver somniferum]